MRGRSRERESRALERGSEARAPCLGSKDTASPPRLVTCARFATRCGGRARENARLARWRDVSRFGDKENVRPRRNNFDEQHTSANLAVTP